MKKLNECNIEDVQFATNQLTVIQIALENIRDGLTEEVELDAWVQAALTKAELNITAVRDYISFYEVKSEDREMITEPALDIELDVDPEDEFDMDDAEDMVGATRSLDDESMDMDDDDNDILSMGSYDDDDDDDDFGGGDPRAKYIMGELENDKI
jgi:hypothetical protein